MTVKTRLCLKGGEEMSSEPQAHKRPVNQSPVKAALNLVKAGKGSLGQNKNIFFGGTSLRVSVVDSPKLNKTERKGEGGLIGPLCINGL